MLSQRFRTLVSIHERAVQIRPYLAGASRSRVNLKIADDNSSPRKPLASVSVATTGLGWRVSTKKSYRATVAKIDAQGFSRSAKDDDDDDFVVVNPGLPQEQPLSENGLARAIVVNSKKAIKSLAAPLAQIESVSDERAKEITQRSDWDDAEAGEILDAFQSLSCHAKFNSLALCDKHASILGALGQKLQQLDNEQLELVFQCLMLWEGIKWNKSSSYEALWKKLDIQCCSRLACWSTETKLLFADYWTNLQIARKTRYVFLAMRQLGKKPNRLTPADFLHTMYLINYCRRQPKNMYEMEYRLDSILDEFTVNELGVICMAFFKTEVSFQDHKLVSRIQTKVLEQWDDIQEISLATIMKMTRYSTGLKALNILYEVLSKATERVAEFSLPCLAHILHAAASVQLHHQELMQKVIERFEKDIDSARIKDIQRISWVLSIFDYDSSTPLYHKIIESLRSPKRDWEKVRFPKELPTTLMHLSYVGLYPLDLIQYCLEPAYLQRAHNNNVYQTGSQFFILEYNVRIEVPEYNGPFLSDAVRTYLAKKNSAGLQEGKNFGDKFISDMAHQCKLALGSDTAVHIDQVLPHYLKPDLIICLDEANKPVPPAITLSKMPVGTIKYQEAGNLRWIAIVVATQNQMITRTDNLTGLFNSKIRQLKKIGYTPIVVRYTNWRDLINVEEKQLYLKKLVSLASKEKVFNSKSQVASTE